MDEVERGHPITLQELLYARGLPASAKTKLVRHRDTSGTIDIHDLYRNHRPAFLDYQRQQGNRVFDKCDFLVACLGEPGSQSRFVGVFQVLGIESDHDLMSATFGSYGEMNNAWTGDDVRGFSKVASNQVMIYEKINNQ